MLVRDANKKIESIENEIEYWLSIKELEELHYEDGKRLYNKEYNELMKDINKNIDILYEEKNELNEFIDNYLKETNKYDDLLQDIIYYKEVDNSLHSWNEIAGLVHFSEVYCRKIYSRYKQKRDI